MYGINLKHNYEKPKTVKTLLSPLWLQSASSIQIPQSTSRYNSIIKIVSEYDQEIQQSQTADNPIAPRERVAQPSRDTRHRLRMDSNLSLRGWGGGAYVHFTGPNLSPRVCCC